MSVIFILQTAPGCSHPGVLQEGLPKEMSSMISIAEARRRIDEQLTVLEGEQLELSAAAGAILATDIHCPVDLPPFRQSSMDGYALRLKTDTNAYHLAGETRAGQPPAKALQPGFTQRIFTGAPIPEDSDTIVKQEDARQNNGIIEMQQEALQMGRYIREVGSDIKSGQLALSAGTILNAGAIALIASMGYESVQVVRKPEVALLVSGDELQQPGNPLEPGQIYESNSQTLIAALKTLRIDHVQLHRLKDDQESIRNSVKQALQKQDVLLFTGGISVGKYDYTARVLKEEGVEEVFHGIAQKPGKPMYFGLRNNTLVFALPGNPASALVCFYEYVYPAILHLTGRVNEGLKEEKIPLGHEMEKRFERAAFERAVVKNGAVHSLTGQESYMLKSLAMANALIALPEGVTQFNKGDLVTVHHLPSF